MLGCYGQKEISTPNIDNLARDGMTFTNAYGCAVCAPARASLICGIHDAHAGRWTFTRGRHYLVRDHDEALFHDVVERLTNTGIAHGPGEGFLGTIAQHGGYTTGQIGKLEWGFTSTPDQLRLHGWDYHFGYYDHVRCHGFYPPFLFENGSVVHLPGNTRADCGVGPIDPNVLTDDYEHDMEGRATYSQDIFDEKIADFIESHAHEPFFLYHPTQLPHGPIMFPDIFPDIADNPNLTRAEKEYASMVRRLDQTVGKIIDVLNANSLLNDTIVIFTSDNGHEPYYLRRDLKNDGPFIDGIDRPFRTERSGDVFDGNDGMAGTKKTNWEGGVRVPLVVKWPQVVEPNSRSTHLVANYDVLGVVAEIAGVPLPTRKDSLSFCPVLRGEPDPPEHRHIVYASFYGPAIVSADGWKLRTFLPLDRYMDFPGFGTWIADHHDRSGARLQLYNLAEDYAEMHDVAFENREKARELLATLLRECDGNLLHGTPNAHFAFTDFDPFGREVL